MARVFQKILLKNQSNFLVLQNFTKPNSGTTKKSENKNLQYLFPLVQDPGFQGWVYIQIFKKRLFQHI